MTDNDSKKTAQLRDASLRAKLIATGVIKPGPDNYLLDEDGCKPLAKYRTRALDDAARDDGGDQ
jgi:hypothetical protein